MSKVLKLSSAFGALALSLLMVSQSRATILATWETTAQTTGEVTYTYVSSSLSNSYSATPAIFTGATNTNLELDFSALNLGPGTYTLNYTVSAASGYVFTDVDLSPAINPVGSALTVSESLNGVLSMTSTGNNIPDKPVTGSPTTLNVSEKIVVASGGSLTSLNNSFLVQAASTPPVPEPASLVVWGVLATGGLCAGAWARRRKTPAKT